jgi:hypothetical protein
MERRRNGAIGPIDKAVERMQGDDFPAFSVVVAARSMACYAGWELKLRAICGSV